MTEQLLTWLNQKLNIDILVVLIVFLSGLFQEKYLCKWIWWKNDDRYDATLKTLAVSFIAGSIYVHLMYMNDRTVPIPWIKYFISYFAATSVYDIAIRPVRKFVIRTFNKWFGNDEDKTPKP